MNSYRPPLDDIAFCLEEFADLPGLIALPDFAELTPDLVTMDMVMPEMDGITAVKQIIAADPNAKIIMCTSMGQQALVVEAIQAGAKSFITKPFQPPKILETIAKVLQ